jgi:hypothetical protein
MKSQKGGLKLINPSKTGFTPIYDMINSPGADVQLLTFSSLKGFMLTLNISRDYSEYVKLKIHKNSARFTEPVTSFILKIAVIMRHGDKTLVPDYHGIVKASESRNSYFEEAKLQQNIWKKSITGGRKEICPPIANFSLFDPDNSINVLTLLFSKTNNNKVKDVIQYLLNQINSNASIGIITMPMVEKSVTFYDFITYPVGDNFYGKTIQSEDETEAYCCVITQLIKLFIFIGVVHYDLHMNNALIYLSEEGKLNCLLIDFGRASNIMEDIDDDYMSIADKEDARTEKENYLNQLLTFENQNDKKRLITIILDYLLHLTHNSQMLWAKYFPKNKNEIVFDNLKNQYMTEGISILPGTIRKYEHDGFFPNFNEPNNFLATCPMQTRIMNIRKSKRNTTKRNTTKRTATKRLATTKLLNRTSKLLKRTDKLPSSKLLKRTDKLP